MQRSACFVARHYPQRRQ